jgi:hypothetical protein
MCASLLSSRAPSPACGGRAFYKAIGALIQDYQNLKGPGIPGAEGSREKIWERFYYGSFALFDETQVAMRFWVFASLSKTLRSLCALR